MTTFGLALDLLDDPDAVARYRDLHRDVPTEVQAALREAGVEQMQIFLSGNRLFMYLRVRDGVDPRTDFARLSAIPAYAAWDDLMRSLQARVPDARPDEWWAVMERVFEMPVRQS